MDFKQVPSGKAVTGTITVKASSGQSVTVSVVANNTAVATGFKGFVESDGVVSIEAEHFVRTTVVDGVGWEVLPGYGKTLSAISPATVPDKRWAAGAGPVV